MTRVTGYLIATLALGLSACTNPMIPGLNFTPDLFKARNAVFSHKTVNLFHRLSG